MIILHFHLQPQFIYELLRIYVTSKKIYLVHTILGLHAFFVSCPHDQSHMDMRYMCAFATFLCKKLRFRSGQFESDHIVLQKRLEVNMRSCLLYLVLRLHFTLVWFTSGFLHTLKTSDMRQAKRAF